MGRRLLSVAGMLPVLLGAVCVLAPGPAPFAETLEGAIATAIQTNPLVNQARARTRAADYDIRQARGGYLPSIDINGGIGPEDSNIKQLKLSGNDNGTLTRREFGLTLRQMIYDGFGTRNEVDRRVSLLEAAEQSTRDVREAVAFDTVQVYLDVLRNRELLVLAEQNVSNHEQVLNNVEQKVRGGVGQRADLEQARGRLALARSVLTARQGQLAESLATYERVVGDIPGELTPPARVASGLVSRGQPDAAAVQSAIGAAITDAESWHPALMQARAELEASEAAIAVARAAYHPRVDLEANSTRNANLAGVEGIRNSNTIMLVGRWNVFRGGSDRAAENAAVERKFAAEENVADVRRVITENIGIALQARAATDARLEYLRAHVEASKQTLEAYKAQFDLGRRTLLDTLNAQNELFTARSNLVSGLYDDLLNQFFVEAAKGRLVSSFGLTPTTP